MIAKMADQSKDCDTVTERDDKQEEVDGDGDDAISSEKEEQEAQELEQVNSFINELNARFQQKKEERLMHNPKNFEYPDEGFFVKLDSSIKKNSAFVKKLRNMTEAQKDVLMKDLASLNLSRYVSELATALVETKIKLNEISMCVKICSALHLRYQEFASQLLDSWKKNLPRKPTDAFNASKMRIDIRLFTELILSGIFTTKEVLPLLGNLLTILTTTDKESHNNLSILLGFCKQYANEFAGLVPRKIRLAAEKRGLTVPICDFLTADRQKGMRNLLKDYYQSLVVHVTKDFNRLQSMENDMKRILMTRGEVSKHQKELFDSRNLEFQKLWSTTQQFADIVDGELPELSRSQGNEDDDLKNDVVFDFSNRFRGDQLDSNSSAHAQLWEDEETRTFYENLPDLKSIIPAILYKDSLKDAQSTDVFETSESAVQVNGDDSGEAKEGGEASKEINEDSLKKEEDIDINEDDFADSGKDMANLNENDELEIALSSIQKTESKKLSEAERKEAEENKGADQQPGGKVGAQKATVPGKAPIDVFFSSLLNCVNRDFIDKAALTFATTFNTKNNRKKLVNVLFTVPRIRLDLLPFYARFVAQLNPIMPTVGTDLVAILKHNFRYLFKKKDQINIESKVKNIRFIGELVKFGIFPKPDVLYILKTLLSDFRYHHVEMTCNLFETCGQYLYRSPDSFHMTSHLLDHMMRHKARMALDSRYAIMVENAYYIVNPPEDKLLSRNIQNKPPMHQFIDNLIYKELAKSTTSKVLIKLRKLDWANPEISSYTIKCLSSVWNLKYYNIVYLAHLLFGLFSYQDWVIPRVLDNIMEDIRLGMQMNSIEFNQRRISVIKFFAECFNYRLIDSGLLFRVLYLLITFGINYSDITQSLLDPPINLMRIRLAAQILHTCGGFLTSGLARRKLDYYLYFFQRYYWLKKTYLYSVPFEHQDRNALFYIDAIFKDVITYLKPKFRIADSYETACKQLETNLKDIAEKAKEMMPNMSISVDQIINPREATAEGNPKNVGLDPIVEEDSLDEEPPLDIENGGDDDESQEGEDEEVEYSDVDDLETIEYDEMAGDMNKEASDSDNEETNENNNAPAIVKCTEDDEFQRDFEKMLSDSLTSRTQEVVRPNVEIVIPIERGNEKKKCNFEVSEEVNDERVPFSMALVDHNAKAAQNNFKFRVMARNAKSNKPLFKTIDVSSDSELVQNFLAQEEELRAEKEAVKKLILDINQRRELEDSSNSPSRSHDGASPRFQPGQSTSGYRPSGYTSNNANNTNTVNYHQYRRRFN